MFVSSQKKRKSIKRYAFRDYAMEMVYFLQYKGKLNIKK